jgi:hypothetical protein
VRARSCLGTAGFSCVIWRQQAPFPEGLAVKVNKGARVSQPNYGPGTVTDSDGTHVVIDFDNHGPKRFVAAMVSLAPTNEPAPEKTKAKRKKKVVAAE